MCIFNDALHFLRSMGYIFYVDPLRYDAISKAIYNDNI